MLLLPSAKIIERNAIQAREPMFAPYLYLNAKWLDYAHRRLCHVMLFSVVLLSASCSWIRGAEVMPIQTQSQVPLGPEAAKAEPKVPFSLEVIEDLNDGQNIHIRARVDSLSSWPIEQVSVRATGFSRGEERTSVTWPLAKLLGQSGQLASQESREIVVALPSQELSDYQLELVWGAVAQNLAEDFKATTGSRIEIQEIQVERNTHNCVGSDCPVDLSVKGRLFNAGTEIAHKVRLGVGLVWVPDGMLDLPTQIPENEEQVEIAELALAAGETQAFALEIGRAIPFMEGGAYQPRVRVLPN